MFCNTLRPTYPVIFAVEALNDSKIVPLLAQHHDSGNAGFPFPAELLAAGSWSAAFSNLSDLRSLLVIHSSCPPKTYHFPSEKNEEAYESAEMYVTTSQNVSNLPDTYDFTRYADRRAVVSKALQGRKTHHCCLSQMHHRSYASSCHPRTPSYPRARCSCSRRRTEAHLCYVSVLVCRFAWNEVNAYPYKQHQSST